MCGHSLSQDTVYPSVSSYWSDSSRAVIRLELLETSSAEAILLFPSSLVGLAIRDVTCSGNGIRNGFHENGRRNFLFRLALTKAITARLTVPHGTRR